MKILCVAEKKSVAVEITRILSNNQGVQVKNDNGCYVSTFRCQSLRDDILTVTCVRGHLEEYDFPQEFNNWNLVDPASLFSAPVVKRFKPGINPIISCLRKLSRENDALYICTDFDREGEAIGFAIASVCQKTNPRAFVRRIRFSALTAQDITRAFSSPVQPDQRLADAVRARICLDLKVGASFTRFLSATFNRPLGLSRLVSYGPCQFPTLFFVVERWECIESFKSQTFWFLELSLRHEVAAIKLSWKCERCYDFRAISLIYENLVSQLTESHGSMTVADTTTVQKRKLRPVPMNTLDMIRRVVEKFRIPSDVCMKAAESLYSKGLISYPRTETQVYHSTISVFSIANSLIGHDVIGTYAANLITSGSFREPLRGSRDDNAHPPIHPLRRPDGEILNELECQVYEMVCRHFLATCSDDAIGLITSVTFTPLPTVEPEFQMEFVNVLQRNWLEIYTYDDWRSSYLNAEQFQSGMQFHVIELRIREATTEPPRLTSESELITRMDTAGIGTDATIHEHIRVIQDRGYVTKIRNLLSPSRLGISLVRTFKSFEPSEPLVEPKSRAEHEQLLGQIAQGTIGTEQYLSESLDIYCTRFRAIQRSAIFQQELLRNWAELQHVQ